MIVPIRKLLSKAAMALSLLVLSAGSSYSQSASGSSSGRLPDPSSSSDTAMVFESPRPLLEREDAVQNSIRNSAGFSVFFSDYGFGVGSFYNRKFSDVLSGQLSIDVGGAKGPKEFGLESEIKVNNILVMPLMASVQYRVLENTLSENLRPFVTAGAGPVFIMTTPGSEGFFSGLQAAKIHTVPGGFVGAGANFGLDKSTSFGANLRYYFIPYPSPGVESTQGVFLEDFNGLFLTATYGFNF